LKLRLSGGQTKSSGCELSRWHSQGDCETTG
jgi:hypothetical protein